MTATTPDDAALRRRRRVNTLTLATPLGLALAWWGRAEVRPGPEGLLLAAGYRARLPAPRAAAVTVGNVVLLRMPHDAALARPGLLRHEAAHARQWARWPVVFLPAYGLAAAWSLLRAGDAATRNGFEVAAGLLDGGYPAAGATRRTTRRTATRTTARRDYGV